MPPQKFQRADIRNGIGAPVDAAGEHDKLYIRTRIGLGNQIQVSGNDRQMSFGRQQREKIHRRRSGIDKQRVAVLQKRGCGADDRKLLIGVQLCTLCKERDLLTKDRANASVYLFHSSGLFQKCHIGTDGVHRNAKGFTQLVHGGELLPGNISGDLFAAIVAHFVHPLDL